MQANTACPEPQPKGTTARPGIRPLLRGVEIARIGGSVYAVYTNMPTQRTDNAEGSGRDDGCRRWSRTPRRFEMGMVEGTLSHRVELLDQRDQRKAECAEHSNKAYLEITGGPGGLY